ncbi:ADP-ribosylglycohydrolase family protein [Pelomyxa schiedti]|nr:ADP-ribosylglycohydrolase family protein [Pelomyxa schiedti]
MAASPALSDKYKGSLLGLAVCDALGTTLEFQKVGSFTPLTTIVGGGPFRLRPGQWTDDTSMALCMAESILDQGRLDLVDNLVRYASWYESGHLSPTGTCFDIGMTVRQSLNRFAKSKIGYSGATGENASGNGCLMRLAPAPLHLAAGAFGGGNCGTASASISVCNRGAVVAAIDASGESARTTHGSQISIDSCRYYAGLIIGALSGATKEVLLSDMFCPVTPSLWDETPLCPEVQEIAHGTFKSLNPPEIVASGYVIKAMEAALWAFHKTSTFEEGALTAANLGDDADTIAAIYGQLAGAYYGAQAIPNSWKQCCSFRVLIESMAVALVGMAQGAPADSPCFSGYRTVKTAYDHLEQAFRPIYRRISPCPTMYRSIEPLEQDKAAFIAEFKAKFLTPATTVTTSGEQSTASSTVVTAVDDAIRPDLEALLADFVAMIDDGKAKVAERTTSASNVPPTRPRIVLPPKKS